MSQAQTIYNLLSDGEWHCVTEMMALYIPDYRRRLVDLRERGDRLENAKCNLHNHQSGNMKMWKLTLPETRHLYIKDRGVVTGEINVPK